MAISDWSTTALCTYTHVRDEYADVGDLTGETVTANQNTVITAYIAKAKIYIGRKLDVILRGKHSSEDYGADADLKDLISNHSELQAAAVSYTLHLLFKDNESSPDDYNAYKAEQYRLKFKDDFADGAALLRFDADASEDIDQEERAIGIGTNRFYRI